MKLFRPNALRSSLGWVLLVAVLSVAAITGKRTLMQEDIGLYNAVLSSPGTLSSATLSAAITTLGTTNKRTLWLTQGSWSLTTDHTIPANIQLWVPHGTTVSIANGKTLTLAGCPKLDAPLWLAPGTTGKVNLTAPGCPTEVHKYATGGAGTSASPWTGFEHIFSLSQYEYVFTNGFFQVSGATPIVLNTSYPGHEIISGAYTVRGAGEGVTIIRFAPTANDQTMFTLGRTDKESLAFSFHDMSLCSTSAYNAYVKKALHLIDVSASHVYNVTIGCPEYAWTDTSRASIGFHLEGRDTSDYGPLFIQADRPMVLAGSPAEGCGTGGFCNIDRSIFHDLYLVVTGIGGTYGHGGYAGDPPAYHPNIEIDPTVGLSRNVFRNIVCNGGTNCILYHGTNPNPGFGPNIFDMLFFEQWFIADHTQYNVASYLQNPANWGYVLDLQTDTDGGAAPIVNTVIMNVYTNGANLLKLRGQNGVTLDNIKYDGNFSADGYCAGSNPTYPCTVCPNALVDNLCPNTPTPKPTIAAPMILDIDKTTGGGVNQDNANILCRNCVAVTGKVILSSNLSIVDIVKPDLAFYPNNPFPSPTRVVWDKTSGSAGTAGTYSWTPALHCEGGEPTLAVAAAAGLVTIQTSGDKKLVTYQGFYALSSKSGGSGNAYIGPTPLDNFPTPSNTANVHHAVAIGKYLGVTFTTGETQLVAFLPQNDTRIVLAEGGLPAATGNNNFLLCSQLGSGFSMMFSGSYVAD